MAHMKSAITSVLILIILLPVLSSAYNLGDRNAPSIQAGLFHAAPVIDGVVNAQEWKDAAATNTFHKLGSESILLPAAKALIGYDKDAIYVAIICPYAYGEKPKAEKRARDGDLWLDDAFEVFIDPTHEHKTAYQFVVNAANSISDSKSADAAWNGDWQVATSHTTDSWSAEFRIPFTTLGVTAPESATTMGLNICLDKKDKLTAYYSWAPFVSGTFHQPGILGHLILAPNGPSMSGLLFTEGNNLGFDMQTIPQTPGIIASLKVTRNGVAVGESSKSLDGTVRLMVPITGSEKPEPADYRWEIDATQSSTGNQLYHHAGVLTISPPLAVSLRKFFIQGKLAVDVDMAGLDGPEPAAIQANIVGYDGKEILTQRTDSIVKRKSTIYFDVSKLAAKDYKVNVNVVDAGNNTIATAQATFAIPPTPVWLNSKAGISDKVLAPWTPLKTSISRGTVSVSPWGRTYTFAGTPFPAIISTRGASILSGPMTLKLVVDGKPVTYKGLIQVVKKTGSQMILVGSGKAGSLNVEFKDTIDFDGHSFVNLKLKGGSNVTLDSMSIEAPIKKQYAKYRYFYPSTNWASSVADGYLPVKGWEHDFVPMVWLGDEDRGFTLYTTSEQNWTMDTKIKPMQAVHSSRDVVSLRFNVVSRPIVLSAQQAQTGLNYEFGFEATPVRKPDKDVWDYRINHSGDYGMVDQMANSSTTLSYESSKLFESNEGTLDLWVRIKFNPDAPIIDPNNKGIMNHDLLVIGNMDEMLDMYWNVDDHGMRIFAMKNQQYVYIKGGRCEWKQGEMHHISMTWGKSIRLYADGKLIVEQVQPNLAIGTKPLGTLRITSTKGGFDIDELRISDIAREPVVPTAPYAVDSHTLLLDHLDNVSKTGSRVTTVPVKGLSSVLDEAAGLTPGKFGNSITVSGKQMPMLDYLRDLGVRTIVFHEKWTEYQNSTETSHQDELKRLVKACHARGIQLLLYFGYELSDISPEWDLYHNECLVYPFWNSYTREPKQKDYIVCYNSRWPEYLADGISRMIDKYDIDGVYLDSTAVAWGCINTDHGCGYVKPDGSLGVTYTFKGTRDMLRRLYTVVKSKKPNGQVNLHNSSTMNIPAVGWATSSWDGEQFTLLTEHTDIEKLLPLDAFRTEFMGRQWGVPSELLCYETPFTTHEALSFTLLHDVLVRAGGKALLEESSLWKTMDKFGRKQAHFLPYWNNSEYAKVSPTKSYTTLYLQPGKRVMCIVSNLSKVTSDVKVALNLQKMKLGSNVTARNALTGESIQIDKGSLKVNLQSYDYALVWVQKNMTRK